MTLHEINSSATIFASMQKRDDLLQLASSSVHLPHRRLLWLTGHGSPSIRGKRRVLRRKKNNLEKPPTVIDTHTCI